MVVIWSHSKGGKLGLFFSMLIICYIVKAFCLVEKIDSRTLSGTNAYIWLIKSPNILSQNINDPIRYSYGLTPDSVIKVDLEFEYWDYFNNKSIFVSKEANKIDSAQKPRGKFENGRQKETDKKRSMLVSGTPLLRFEDFPMSCMLVFRTDEISRLVGNIELINLTNLFSFGTKQKGLRIHSTLNRFVKYTVFQWKNAIGYFVPNVVSKSMEKTCLRSLNDMMFPNLKVNSSDRNTERRVEFYLDRNETNNLALSGKSDENIFIETIIRVEPFVNNIDRNTRSGNGINNVFLLLLNSEQLAALNHSPMQDLTLISISNNYATHFNVNSYIRSMIRIPIQESRLKFEYKVQYLDRYSLLVVNGDRIPLLIKGNITVNNPEPLGHLSFERRMDKSIVKLMFTLYIIAIIGYAIMIVNDHEGSFGVTNLQLISIILLVMKPVCLYFDNNNLDSFAKYGQIEFTNWFIPRVLERIHETVFLIYMLLISLGWKVLRDNLLSIEIRLIFCVFVILFYIGIFEMLFGIFQITRYIFNAIVSLCIIVATNINVTLIQNTISENSISPRIGILYKKWQSYLEFKWIFTFYIIKPTFLFFWRIFTLQSNGYDDWVNSFLDQFIDFVIILYVIITFRSFKISKLFRQLYPKGHFENANGSTSNNNDNDNDNNNYYLFNNNGNHYVNNIDVSMWPVII